MCSYIPYMRLSPGTLMVYFEQLSITSPFTASPEASCTFIAFATLICVTALVPMHTMTLLMGPEMKAATEAYCPSLSFHPLHHSGLFDVTNDHCAEVKSLSQLCRASFYNLVTRQMCTFAIVFPNGGRSIFRHLRRFR